MGIRGWTALVSVSVVIGLMSEARRTRPIRKSMRTFTGLISAANRGDLAAARWHCSDRLLQEEPLERAPEGGIVGVPSGIHPNFRAWRYADSVLVCPANRVGPVYSFREEGGRWRFDGLIGLLTAAGEIERSSTASGPRIEPPQAVPAPRVDSPDGQLLDAANRRPN